VHGIDRQPANPGVCEEASEIRQPGQNRQQRQAVIQWYSVKQDLSNFFISGQNGDL